MKGDDCGSAHQNSQPWDIPEHQITPETLYWNRRQILRAMGLTGVGLAGVLAGCKSNQEVEQQIQQQAQALPKLSAPHNDTFSLDRPLTEEKVAAHYNNFYEFSSGKDDVWELAAFESEPWKVEITGLVQRPQTLDIDDIRRLMPWRAALPLPVCGSLGHGRALDWLSHARLAGTG